jgi:hypothetical protein
VRRSNLLLMTGAVALVLLSPAASQPAPASAADALSAAGDFAGAARAYQAALAASPNDPAALAGLGRVRLYENRIDDATALAQQALVQAPANPVAQATLRVAQQRREAFGEARYRISGLSSEAVVPFVATDPLPVVQVTIGGRQAYFLIDTGAPDIMVAPDLAKEMGLQTQSAGEGVFAGGVRANVERTIVPELQIGAIRIADAPAGIMRQTLPMPGRKIEGIIGTGLLMHFLPTLDYCQGRLVLRPRSASAAVEPMAARTGANIVPIWLAGDHFILARARLLHGRERLFLIDTGLAGGGLSADKAVLEEAGVVIDPAAAQTGIGGGGPVTVIPFRAGATLGALTVEDVPGFYSPGGNPLSIFPFEMGGLLSHGFFRQTRLTFDFDAMRLITEACRPSA